LTEIAPGIDLEVDVLAHMEFRPQVSPDLQPMDARLFHPQSMEYAGDLLQKPRLNIPARLREGLDLPG
jgi:propionate CoA-transferase